METCRQTTQRVTDKREHLRKYRMVVPTPVGTSSLIIKYWSKKRRRKKEKSRDWCASHWSLSLYISYTPKTLWGQTKIIFHCRIQLPWPTPTSSTIDVSTPAVLTCYLGTATLMSDTIPGCFPSTGVQWSEDSEIKITWNSLKPSKISFHLTTIVGLASPRAHFIV